MSKIILNSAPRTGLAWLQFVLSESMPKMENKSNVVADNFIVRSHVPVMLLGNFNDITQCFVLRSPLDLISSIVTKTMGGYGFTINNGKSMPNENINNNIKLLIDAQFDQYILYSSCATKNIDNIMPFTFEQVTKDINYVTKNILNANISNELIPELMKKSMSKVIVHDKGHPGYNNFLPTENKPEVYETIKSMLKENKKMIEMQEVYEETKLIIAKRQDQF